MRARGSSVRSLLAAAVPLWSSSGDDVRPAVLAAEICALLNHEGGCVLLGVEDDGSVTGLGREPSQAEEWVMQATRDPPAAAGDPELGSGGVVGGRTRRRCQRAGPMRPTSPTRRSRASLGSPRFGWAPRLGTRAVRRNSGCTSDPAACATGSSPCSAPPTPISMYAGCWTTSAGCAATARCPSRAVRSGAPCCATSS